MSDPTTPAYDRLIEDASMLAVERGEYVDAVHVALTMLTDPESELSFILRDQMGTDVGELARRLRWRLDRPHGGPGEHGVAELDGTTTIRHNDTLETVTSWTPEGDPDASGR